MPFLATKSNVASTKSNVASTLLLLWMGRLVIVYPHSTLSLRQYPVPCTREWWLCKYCHIWGSSSTKGNMMIRSRWNLMWKKFSFGLDRWMSSQNSTFDQICGFRPIYRSDSFHTDQVEIWSGRADHRFAVDAIIGPVKEEWLVWEPGTPKFQNLGRTCSEWATLYFQLMSLLLLWFALLFQPWMAAFQSFDVTSMCDLRAGQAASLWTSASTSQPVSTKRLSPTLLFRKLCKTWWRSTTASK